MEKSIVIRGWAHGMNNLAPEHAMPEGALRDVVNLDVLDTGKIRTRKGYAPTPVHPGSSVHSLFAHEVGVFVMDNGTLKRLNSDMSAPSAVVSGLSASRRLTYVDLLQGKLLWSNGEAIGVVEAGGVPSGFGVEVPERQPLLSAIPGGALHAGRYQVAVTFVSDMGQESGALASAFIDVAEGQGVLVANLPQPQGSGVADIQTYISEVNGDVLYLANVSSVGTSSIQIDASTSLTAELRTQFHTRFPPADILELAFGRLWGAVGSALIYSAPFAYGQTVLGRNAIYFPEQISVLAAVDDGIWLVADQTYFLLGRVPGEQQLKTIFPYRAVPRTTVRLPVSKQLMWLSERGFVMAGNGGQITNVSEDRIAPSVDTTTDGSAVLREQDGLRHVVATGSRGASSGFVVSDFAEGEVVRASRVEWLAEGLALSDSAEAQVIYS
jgi:hypothetical protein